MDHSFIAREIICRGMVKYLKKYLYTSLTLPEQILGRGYIVQKGRLNQIKA